MNDFSNLDLRVYFRRNKSEYFFVFLSIILGVVLGIIISFFSDRYLSLIDSKNNVLFSFIKGDFSFTKEVFKLCLKFIIPTLILIGLGIYYYLIILSYGFLVYNGALFVLNIISLFLEFGVSSLISVLILIIPINLIIFIVLSFVFVENKNRAKLSRRTGNFFEGYNKVYFLKMGGVIMLSIIFSTLYIFILSMFLRCNIFIIF